MIPGSHRFVYFPHYKHIKITWFADFLTQVQATIRADFKRESPADIQEEKSYIESKLQSV